MPRSNCLLACIAGAGMAVALPAFAQETGIGVWDRVGCFTCHGNLAAGDGEEGYPPSPNLRRTHLDRGQLTEVIACGRPGTEMPMHLVGAYTEVSCYGMPAGERPDDVKGLPLLTAAEVEAVTDFLVEHVVGQRRITRENCAQFFGGDMNVPACRQF